MEGLCKSGLPTIHFKSNHEQLPIISITQSLIIYYRIITEGRPRQCIQSFVKETHNNDYLLCGLPSRGGPNAENELSLSSEYVNQVCFAFCIFRFECFFQPELQCCSPVTISSIWVYMI